MRTRRPGGDVGSDLDRGAGIAPGKRTWTERLPVQRRAAAPVAATSTAGPRAPATEDPFWFTQVAADGVAGAAAPLPHQATVQAAFGRHGAALDGVRAQVGGDAAEAAGTIGAQAYAIGDRVGFAGEPDLHLAAHEAAHVVQQRAGVSLSGGVGAAGDAYEQHADRVADAVVAGRSAEALLDAGPRGGAAGPALQRKDDAAPAPAEDPEARLERIIDHLEVRLSLATNDMNQPGEVERIAAHAHAMAVLLAEAARLLDGLPGTSAAGHVADVGRLEEGVKTMLAWATKARVEQAKVELDRAFDAWDRMRQAVGLEPVRYAARYYAEWQVDPSQLQGTAFADGGATQGQLVDDCVRMFELDQTLAPMLAIDQFETMLQEPPPPPGGPSLLETLLSTAVSAVLGMIPGKLGGLVEAALGDAEPRLARVIVGFTEQSAELVIGEASADEGGGIGEGQLKTEYLDRIRRGLFTAMRQLGAGIGKYRALLERLPPAQVAAIHRGLAGLAEQVWARVKQDVVVQWVNFRASLPHGLVDGTGQLDFDVARRDGESFAEGFARRSDRTGIVELTVAIRGDELEERAPSLSGIEPAVVRELASAATPFMAMPLHRKVNVSRINGHVGVPEPIARLYLTATHQLVIEWSDDYFMAQVGRGEAPHAPWDGMGGYEEINAERAPRTGDPGQAFLGAWRVLGMIKTTSAALG